MKSHLCLLLSTVCFVAATSHAPWPLFFVIFSLYSLLSLLLTAWLVPGGMAWCKPPHFDRLSTIPGPSGWPLLGSIPIMGPLAHRRLAKLCPSFDGAKHLMAFSLGTTRVVVSSHAETAKEILSSPAFADRPPKLAATLLMFDRAMGFAPYGDYWRHLRRLAANNMLSPRSIASSEGRRRRIAVDMMRWIDDVMEGRGMVELRVVLQRAASRSVAESVVGSRDVDVEEIMELVREGYELVGRFGWEDHLPAVFGGLLDFRGVRKRCLNLAARVKSVFGGVIRKRWKEEGTCVGDVDFLGVLMSLPESDRLSDSDMIAVVWEMIFRGADVVAILLEWIMARMVLHPAVQAQVQQELDQHVGPSRTVQDSDVPNLRYLQAVVKEVLRLHPPGPLLSWARLAVHDVHVAEHLVPAGTTAMVNMWAITHDASVWKDPWAFRPERFMEEDVSVMGSDLRLAPFGSGRRVCPGRALGLATVHLWLAQLLHRYHWLPGRPVRLSECLRLSLEMKKPLVCRTVPRKLVVGVD